MGKVLIRNRGTKENPSWEYRFEAAKIDGKRKHISKSGYKTKGAAQKAGTAALAEYNASGRTYSVSTLSVADLCALWMNEYCRYNTADSTYALRESLMKNHIIPAIGKYKAATVKPDTLQNSVNKMSANLARSSMRVVMSVIREVFNYAEKKELIATSPARYLTVPRNKQASKEIIILSVEDVKRILDHYKGKPHIYYAMLISYYTGLRIGETYGLTWQDVDLEAKTISVTKAIKSTVSSAVKDFYLGAPKTKTSVRTIAVGDTLCNALAEWKERQKAYQREFGQFYIKCYKEDVTSDNGLPISRVIQSSEKLNLPRLNFICTRKDGSYSGLKSAYPVAKTVNNTLGIKYNFHAFRHTHATMLIEAGVPVKIVSQRLGHATINTTLNLYVKVTEKMENDAVKVFESQYKIE